jgi:hypothetical protein
VLIVYHRNAVFVNTLLHRLEIPHGVFKEAVCAKTLFSLECCKNRVFALQKTRIFLAWGISTTIKDTLTIAFPTDSFGHIIDKKPNKIQNNF